MGTAFIIIDVQRELVEALEPQRRLEFIGTLQLLLASARAHNMPVVYVRHDGGDEELRANTPGWHIAAEIAPRDGEAIVEKRFRDAFRETNLADVLAKRGIDHVVIAGMQSEFCVDATVREAERRGYRVTLVEDGHATFPAGGLSEIEIRRHVNRVAYGEVAAIVPSPEAIAAMVSEPSTTSSSSGC